jgi:phosphotransferase system HPr (HPr) family protein
MYKKDAIVKSEYGMHARPSAFISTNATKLFPKTVITIEDKETGNKGTTDSILSLLTMALNCGKKVTVYAVGENEKEAAEFIANIIDTYEV